MTPKRVAIQVIDPIRVLTAPQPVIVGGPSQTFTITQIPVIPVRVIDTGSGGGEGPQGPAGPAGPAGAAGAAGVAGKRGRRGSLGFAGQSGADGLALPGKRGARGVAGTAGAPGAAGAAGAQGKRGTRGIPAFTNDGQDGFPGVPGHRGKTGAQGPQGPQGDPGGGGAAGRHASMIVFPGAQVEVSYPSRRGQKGQTGTAGSAGSPGATGARGRRGAPGFANDGVDGLSVPGRRGKTGTAGTAGPQGPQGNQGTAGTAGATGKRGRPVPFAGSDGDPGFALPGRRGRTGLQGSAGSAGTNGTNGKRGRSIPIAGSDGIDGLFVPGRRGKTGQAGTNGTNGANGTNGKRGKLGFPGIDGIDGFFVPGKRGKTGSQGSQGTTGSAGAAGIGAGFAYVYGTSTSNAQPTSNHVIFDSLTFTSILNMRISQLDQNSNNFGDWLAALVLPSHSPIYLLMTQANGGCALFQLTGTITKNTASPNWYNFTVAPIASGNMPGSNGTAVTLTVLPSAPTKDVDAGSSAPTTTNDAAHGYVVGSIYYQSNLSRLQTYVCTSNTTGSATWKLLPPSNYLTRISKTSGNQTLTTSDVTVSFDNAVNNDGSYFNTSTNTYTPPAGGVWISATCAVQIPMTNTKGSAIKLAIYKNGSIMVQGGSGGGIGDATVTPTIGVSVSVADIANGTDAYTIRASYVDVGATSTAPTLVSTGTNFSALANL